jgi:3-mercaptopyruvate sulfurtransferase SseA
LIFSVFTNFIRSKPIDYISKGLEKVESLDDLNLDDAEGITEVSLSIAQGLFEKKTLFIDARAKEYYLEGHIPGAICFDDFDTLTMEIDNRIQNNEFFVVYCSDDDCGSSEELSYQLLEEGFTSIYLFRGGWKQWINNNMPIEQP